MAKALGKKPAEGVCRKNEFLCANSVMLCVSVVKLPGKTFTTEARSLHREPRRNFSDRLLRQGVNEIFSTSSVPAQTLMKITSSRRALFALCVVSLIAPQLVSAQKQSAPATKPFELTVDSIMRGPRLVGYPPAGVYWSQNSQRVYFRWKQPDEPRLKEMSLYVVNRDGTGLRCLTDEEAKQAPPANGELSKDKSMTVFADEGDIFIYDHAKGSRRQITKTVDAETNAHFTFDRKHIYFTRLSNLYVMSLMAARWNSVPSFAPAGAHQWPARHRKAPTARNTCKKNSALPSMQSASVPSRAR